VADGLTIRSPAIALRPATPDDQAFLLAVYGSTRADELSIVPWTDEEKSRFVEMQFEAQDAHYRQAYPDGRFLVVAADDVPIGRLYVATLAGEVRLIDIALLPAHRGAGIGTSLVVGVLREADAAGLPVRLHVEPWNPARRLYERLGFVLVETGPVYDLLERPPAGVS
jgi:ribosomal protein S18 acetylase RimI-like enzyme